MKIFGAALVGIGLLVLGGCAVYEPYPAYPSYPAAPPQVVVQPRVYGYWDHWSGPRYGHRHGHWGGPRSGHRHWR
ncbi:MAG TPA: hypothetical protein VD978_20220 [Azospirillum sp.]|nr:hypothetical protein [Azospirillum sp.]